MTMTRLLLLSVHLLPQRGCVILMIEERIVHLNDVRMCDTLHNFYFVNDLLISLSRYRFLHLYFLESHHSVNYFAPAVLVLLISFVDGPVRPLPQYSLNIKILQPALLPAQRRIILKTDHINITMLINFLSIVLIPQGGFLISWLWI